MRFILLELLGLLKIVRRTVFPPCCRFHPTCTEYAQQALQSHSPIRATFLIFGRILRCHPFHPGGIDPVALP